MIASWHFVWAPLGLGWRDWLMMLVILAVVTGLVRVAYWIVEWGMGQAAYVKRPPPGAEPVQRLREIDSGGKDLPWCEACRCWHPVGVHVPETTNLADIDAPDVWTQWNKDR